MSCRVFQNKVRSLIERAGMSLNGLRFSVTDNGLYVATLPDGIVIKGNGISKRVEISTDFGHHKYFAEI